MSPAERPRAVLFDFDGVVGDTIEDNFRAWTAAFAPHGITADRIECFLLEGKKTAELAAEILRRCGKDPNLGAAVGAAKDAHYQAHNNFSFYPGVGDLIARIQNAGMKAGLVSGGMKRRLVNPQTEAFLARFDAIVTADDCLNGKPDPEPFLKGAEKLGVPPHTCVVIENAPLGITAAKRAGMRCIAVTSSLPAEYLKEADAIVARAADAGGLLPL